jgi:hypothetical protein
MTMTIEHHIRLFEKTVTIDGKPKTVKTFYFTTADEPVTWRSQQYIPLSVFDQAKWLSEELKDHPVEPKDPP